jgi:hypothetical protein
MAESPRAVDVRLTIPGDAPYPDLAGDLAAKFAQYSGATADAAGRLSAGVRALAAKIGSGRDVTLTLEAGEREVRVTAAAGDRREHAVFPF